MPRLGGLGIFFAFLVGYMLFGQNTIKMNSILIGSFIVVLTGIVDYIKPVSAKYKFIAQLVASAVIPFYGGIILQETRRYDENANETAIPPKKPSHVFLGLISGQSLCLPRKVPEK